MLEQIEGLSRPHVIAGIAASGLLTACGKGAADALTAPAATAAAAGEKLAHGGMADWAALAGTVFDAGGGISVTLIGVEALPSDGKRPADVWREKAFLAVFRATAPLPGDLIYSVSASGVGPLDLFLASASSDAFPHRVHAVFN